MRSLDGSYSNVSRVAFSAISIVGGPWRNLIVIDAYPLGNVTATQRAVLDGLVARLATADMAAGQKDDPSLEEERERE